jgi:hypothetical protein
LRKHQHNPTAARSGSTLLSQSSGSWTTATLSIPLQYLAATSSQNLVFFGGGWAGTMYYDRVDIYNTLNGSWSTATSVNFVIILQPLLLEILFSLKVVGVSVAYFSNIYVFNVTSNTWTTTTLSQARSHLAATSVDNRYVLLGGGNNGSGLSNVVDIFDLLSGMWNTTTLSQA